MNTKRHQLRFSRIFFGILMLAGFLTASSLTGTTPSIQAQTPQQTLPPTQIGPEALKLNVSPPVQYLTVKPGETQTHRIRVEQSSSKSVLVSPHILSFQADGATGTPLLQPTSDFSYATIDLPTPNQESQITLFQTNQTIDTRGFILDPGQSKQILITITVPQNAREGEYPLTVLFFAEPAPGTEVDQANSQTSVRGSIGSNLIVGINQTDTDRGKLNINTIQTPRIVDSLLGLSVQILAENSGLNATTASGSATITNWQGKKVAQFDFFPDMLLAKSTRFLRTSNENPDQLTEMLAESFSGDTNLNVQFDPSQLTTDFSYNPLFMIGPYTIRAEIFHNGQVDPENPGESQKKEVTSTKVFAFPYSLASVALILLVGWSVFLLIARTKEDMIN